MKRMTSRLAKVLQVLVALTAILALAGLLALVIVPKAFGWQPVVVRSGSMEPALPVGSLVFLERVQPEQVKVGDVISYHVGNARVTHRVVEVGKDATGAPGFQTKGDANAEPDAGMVAASTVDRREVMTLPYVGTASNFVRSRNGFYAIILVPAAIIIASSVTSIVVELNRQRRKAAA